MNLRQLIARFRREERGNVLIMAGLGAFTLVGGAGLATDATQWFLWKRQIQMAADAGALAAAHTLAQGSTQLTTPATREIERNRNGTYTIEFIGTRPRTGAFINDPTAAEVVVTTQKRLPFSSLFRRTAPVVRARAVAAKVIKSDSCVISLATTGIGVQVQGSANIQLGCGVSANSTGTQAIYLQGAAFLNATTLAAVGNIDPKEGSLSTGTEQLPFAPAQTDPFGPQGRNLQVPTDPATCLERNYQTQPSDTGVILRPGRYCGGMTLRGTSTFESGVYIIDGGSFHLGSQANVTGSNVTFILTGNGSNIATIQVDGGAVANLTAPTAAQNPTWAGILFFQDRRGQTTQSQITGTGNVQFNGAVYLPNGDISYTGNSIISSQCLLIVAQRVSFHGNGQIANNCPRDLRDQVALRVIRVVE